MKKLKPTILTSVFCAVVFLVISSWVFNYGLSILPYLILAGCFIVWVQKETVTHKFLIKLLVGSLIFGFISAILIFLRMYVMSNFIYDNPIPIFEFWDQDTWLMASVFSFVSFLGGLLGIVLKGFYSLYKNKLIWVIVFLGPLLVTVSSLAIFKVKIGGTIMNSLHGWPYPFLTHQIKDVLDGFSIDKWRFSPGSFYHYVIFDYLLYLVLFLAVYFAIKLINKKLKIKKINSTIFLFGFMVLLTLKCTSIMSAKESYISYQIANAGYCQQNSDCMIIANRWPFSCAIISNKDNADRILKLVSSYPSTGELQCLGSEEAVCISNKCRIAINQMPENNSNDQLATILPPSEVPPGWYVHRLSNSRIILTKQKILTDIVNTEGYAYGDQINISVLKFDGDPKRPEDWPQLAWTEDQVLVKEKSWTNVSGMIALRVRHEPGGASGGQITWYLFSNDRVYELSLYLPNDLPNDETFSKFVYHYGEQISRPDATTQSINSGSLGSLAETQIQETIRNFMAEPDLTLKHVSTEKNPSNFTVGKVTVIREGAWNIETPKEWERPTYVFQQTKYIDNLCEVYEYEIDARNGQLVEVHVKYPQSDMELSQEAKSKKCKDYGSLYTPLKTKVQIETVAMDYLSRAIANFDQIKSRFVYKPSAKNAVNAPAANEWFWQDTNYKLPEGLSGDVYNYPTIRIIVSSGGKLIHYFNSVELFN
ncbi:MAG: hypothetical protein WC508_04645 [Patescibacteria group bacterium]